MVPKGWEDCLLSEITKWSSGGTPSKSNKEYWNGDIPWISASSMRGYYYSDSYLKITERAVSEKAKMADKENILLLVRGSMLWNKILVGVTTRRVAFNQDVKCISPILAKLDINFLLYWFLAKENQLMGMVTGTGIGAGKLDTNDLQNLNVLLPPLPEQQKIAKILTTWDNAIRTTERLIENSRQQKKALMQQLLTGKKQLLDDEGKQFEIEWNKNTLSNLCQISTGKKDVNEGNPNGKYPFYTCAKEHTFSDAYSFDCEALLIAGNGNIGTTHYHNGKFEAYQRTYVLKEFKDINIKYLFQFLLYALNREVERNKQHGAMPYIKVGFLNNFIVLTPSLEEQQKIATVLTNADKEIELLEQQLADLQQEKKALMQQLLTGKRRVVVDGEVA